MQEVWLHPNVRALAFGMTVSAVGIVAGIALIRVPDGGVTAAVCRASGGLVLIASAVTLANLAWRSTRPRIGYHDGEVLIHLRQGRPIGVPIDVVECFLLGHGPSLLPGQRNADVKSATIVVRLSERAEAFRQMEVKPALGSWCDGHVTVRGTWCEPINIALVNRLNERLAEVKQHMAQGVGY